MGNVTIIRDTDDGGAEFLSASFAQAAKIAKQSVETGKTVRQLCEEMEVLPPDELKAALDPATMTSPSA